MIAQCFQILLWLDEVSEKEADWKNNSRFQDELNAKIRSRMRLEWFEDNKNLGKVSANTHRKLLRLADLDK